MTVTGSPPRPRRPPRRWPLAVLGVLVIAAVVVLILRRPAGETVGAFADAWSRHDWTAMDDLSDARGELAERFERVHTGLGVGETSVEAGEVTEGTAPLRIAHDLGPLGTWSYETDIRVVGGFMSTSVVWEPTVLHPSLEPGLELRRTSEWPERAPILAHDSEPLAFEGTVVLVGLEPRRIRDREETLAALSDELDLDPEEVTGKLDAPGVQPDWFIPLVELNEEPYQRMRSDLAPIPGVVFRRVPARVTPTPDFASHVLGRTGEVTAERLEELGPPYSTGDEVGLSGLELLYEERLAGTPAIRIAVTSTTGRVVEVLHEVGATETESIRTTLDLEAQTAAEEALEGVEGRAAIVAVDPATGAIRAVASRPVDEPFNRALAGRYPPGSTFKIVTSAAILAEGHTPDETVACPAEVEIGRPFRNSEGRALGEITLREAFVESCNTAFVRLANGLGTDSLAAAARRFGFGANYELPLPVAGGRFPSPEDDAELAAASIGQGRVAASPLHMATVAAGAADGTWRTPFLLPGTDSPTRNIDAGHAAIIRGWMRGVVEEGTGTAAHVDGEDVSGKTGTAEFGEGDPPEAHAWFVGFQGNLAFAIIVEGGGSGGEVAAPIAARFVGSL